VPGASCRERSAGRALWPALASLVGFAVLLASGCPARRAASQQAAKPGAAAFSLPALDGSSVSLAQFKGKPVVIDFWATWCPPCRLSIPELVKLHATYSAKGVAFLGIALNDTPEELKKFQRENGIGYQILLGTNDVAEAYAVEGIPTLVVLDKQGSVVHRSTGFDPDSGLVVLERALKTVSR
jgi:thiol-disulfide isomerase/thioredoxin